MLSRRHLRRDPIGAWFSKCVRLIHLRNTCPNRLPINVISSMGDTCDVVPIDGSFGKCVLSAPLHTFVHCVWRSRCQVQICMAQCVLPPPWVILDVGPWRKGKRKGLYGPYLLAVYSGSSLCHVQLMLIPLISYRRGKRKGVYGAYLLAVYNEEEEQFQTISKIGTGFSEQLLIDLAASLQPSIIPGPKPYYRCARCPHACSARSNVSKAVAGYVADLVHMVYPPPPPPPGTTPGTTRFSSGTSKASLMQALTLRGA